MSTLTGDTPDVALPKTALRKQPSTLVSMTLPRKSTIAVDKKVMSLAVIPMEDGDNDNSGQTDEK